MPDKSEIGQGKGPAWDANAIRTRRQNTKKHDFTRSHMPDKSEIGQGKGPVWKVKATQAKKRNAEKYSSARSPMPDKSEIGQGKGLDQFQPESKIQKT